MLKAKQEGLWSYQAPRETEFLLRLSYYDRKKPSTFRDFEKYLGFSKPRPDLRRLLGLLRQKQIVVLYDTTFGIKRYTLDTKKLINSLIDELEITDLFARYFIDHNKLVGWW